MTIYERIKQWSNDIEEDQLDMVVWALTMDGVLFDDFIKGVERERTSIYLEIRNSL